MRQQFDWLSSRVDLSTFCKIELGPRLRNLSWEGLFDHGQESHGKPGTLLQGARSKATTGSQLVQLNDPTLRAQ